MSASAPAVQAPASTRSATARPGVIDQLNQEWDLLIDDPGSRRIVGHWAKATPVLDGCDTVEAVRAHLAAASKEGQDAILVTLLEAGHHGDRLAHRTVFQAFIGAAIARGYNQTWRTRQPTDELAQDIVTALWTAIATYPLHRRTKIPANLVMESTHQLSRIRAQHTRHYAETPHNPLTTTESETHTPLESTAGPGRWASTSGSTDANPAVDLLEVIAFGIDTGTITADQAALLIRVYCPPPGHPGGRTVATELGITWATLRQRCSRATRALATVVAHHTTSRAGARRTSNDRQTSDFQVQTVYAQHVRQ